MRNQLILSLLLFTLSVYSQTPGDSLIQVDSLSSDTVSFVTTLDIAHLTKDGIYLNGYVVNIGYRNAKKLNGKTIRITGKVTIMEGVKNQPPPAPQLAGREGDYKYIDAPKIEVIK